MLFSHRVDLRTVEVLSLSALHSISHGASCPGHVYLENGCEIVPLKRGSSRESDYSLMLLDIQADFSDFLIEEKNIISDEKLVNPEGNIFNVQKRQYTQKQKTAGLTEREKYVHEIDHLWAYMEWHYNFEDEIKVQKSIVTDVGKLRKVPRLYVSAHIIEGMIHEMSKNENICMLKYTTYPSFYNKYGNEMENVTEQRESSIYNRCNYIYEVCDVADKSLVFASSPVINTTIKNVLSITKSGKKREDFNEEQEEKEDIVQDEIWQIYLSKRIKCINDQWLLICINQEVKDIIKNSGEIYFKIFNKYIKEYNDFLKSHNYNTSDDKNDMHGSSMFRGHHDRHNMFEMNNGPNESLNSERLKKYRVNLIFSGNKDINYILYKLCLNLGKINDAVLCTRNKTYNILLNDIDGTLAICLKSFFSKYYGGNAAECKAAGLSNTAAESNAAEDLVKTLSIMGLCKEKLVLSEKATIFSNIELLFSYYLIVHSESLEGGVGQDDAPNQDGVIYLSRKALFENLQFSTEEICSYLLHMQKYSTNNLLFVKGRGFRYVKSEIIYEFLVKIIELVSIHDELYAHHHVERGRASSLPFKQYKDDLHKVVRKRHGITLQSLVNLIQQNETEFAFLKNNKIAMDTYIILQLCWKCCDIENKHFDFFSLYYNYYFFYEYLSKPSEEISFEGIFNDYLQFLDDDSQVSDTVVYFNLFKLHKIMSLNILRSSGKVVIHSDELFTFDMDMFTYVKYIDEMFRNFNSNVMDKIIQDFIKCYQFFLDCGYDRRVSAEKALQNGQANTHQEKTFQTKTLQAVAALDAAAHAADAMASDTTASDVYKDRVLFRNNTILNVSNINHICNDSCMFEYFIVVKYYYTDNTFSLLEKKLKKFIHSVEEDFSSAHMTSATDYSSSGSGTGAGGEGRGGAPSYHMRQNYKANWKKAQSNYSLNYKIFKYQTNSFPQIRLSNNYNELLCSVYTPLAIHFSIFHENVIYNKKRNSFQLIPSFLLKENLRSCLTALFTFKNSYFAQEFYPFLNPLLNNKDLIGTIAVPPLRHCRTKLIERENEKNVEFLETGSIVLSTLNSDMKSYTNYGAHSRKLVEKLCKLYNCNLPVNSFSP
ncbi:hypothetical protein C922_02652 [Plasmodium inui San Antonio 1]|uniref:Uncharacterized protein n=1 Tax=Plasmodium inui San Antonio 1 TaxID=1237626 RepID=W7A759_9APIC|nr:hypothetical protein C922_02652 [Plasmodium inui San Antonio 1]EUD67068.1 hypothetical protein C922_02652 [Plasmodium inui San Antonio 1]